MLTAPRRHSELLVVESPRSTASVAAVRARLDNMVISGDEDGAGNVNVKRGSAQTCKDSSYVLASPQLETFTEEHREGLEALRDILLSLLQSRTRS